MNCEHKRVRGGQSLTQGQGLTSVVLFDLIENETVQAVSDTEKTQVVLTGEDFEPVGPGTEDIVVHVECTNAGAQLRYDVMLQRRFKDGRWLDAGAAVLSGVDPNTAGNEYMISAPFSDRADLGMKVRLVLIGGSIT